MTSNNLKTSDKTLNFLLKYFYCLGVLPKVNAKSKRNVLRTCFVSAMFIISITTIIAIKEIRGFVRGDAFNLLNHFTDASMAILMVFTVTQFGIFKYDKTKQLFQQLRCLNSVIPEEKQTMLYKYKAGIICYTIACLTSLIITEYCWTGLDDGFYFYEIAIYNHVLIGYSQGLIILMWYIWDVVKRSYFELNIHLEKRDITLDDADKLIVWHTSIADCVVLINDLFGGILFLLTLEEVMHTLNTLYYDIHVFDYSSYALHYMLLVWTMIVVVQSVIVSIMCERVVDEGKKAITISYKALYRYSNVPAIREKLFILAHQTSARCPSFSAAGFFNVDFGMLFTFVNLITTYVIVIIQLSIKS